MMRIAMETIYRLPGLYLRHRITEVARMAVELPALWHQRQRERKSLARLNDRLLADVGLTRLDQDHECNKPFWQP